ncbi:TetR/AcrR family transcriptional regulator [Haloechinothrix salitolerans]|uniref:TetR/AcrR family transcriptional regulator n=1 Tax=Haloechinothrix salitolerans TaxID=926830 RepID=A0ABW2BW67_9PSEU
MNAVRTARQRARDELTSAIKAEALRQVVAEGPQRLSLRSIARELGMASSAIYRYFPSRDDLLTALIIDAYDSLGAAVEDVESHVPREYIRARWQALCAGVRTWARQRSQEYALIFGSPVPGYRAPEETIAPASRVAVVLGKLLADGWAAGELRQVQAPPLRPGLAEQAEGVATAIAPDVPSEVLARALVAWTQLFGMVSFELFGHLVGSADPADEFFEHAVGCMADLMGLPAE